MRGAITPLPNTPSWRSVRVKKKSIWIPLPLPYHAIGETHISTFNTHQKYQHGDRANFWEGHDTSATQWWYSEVV